MLTGYEFSFSVDAQSNLQKGNPMPPRQKIFVIVHHEHFAREDIRGVIARRFPDSSFVEFTSESEFHAAFGRLIDVSAFIFGVWVPHCLPAPGNPPSFHPSFEATGGTRGAGYRMWVKVRSRPDTARTPVIIYEERYLSASPQPIADDDFTEELNYDVDQLIARLAELGCT